MNTQTTILKRSLAFLMLLFATLIVSLVPNQSRADTSLPVITVYKSPTCGCCGKWIEHLQSNGLVVDAQNRNDLDSIKRKLGIEPRLQACHTARIGNYIVEGHVPAADIKRMLAEKPDIAGLVVPGMPMGSPGMEGARKDNYDVLAIKQGASPTIYNSY